MQTGKVFHFLPGLVAMLALFTSLQAAAKVTARVDRSLVDEFDQVTLTLRVSDDGIDLTPDFTALEDDFDIVGNSSHRNTSVSIINGRTTSAAYREHLLVLKPKRLGKLTIPALVIGQFRTEPIDIHVRKQSEAVRQQMNRLVFLRTGVDTRETYVQSQVVYTVKLFYSEGLGGDFPGPPALQDAVVETIENEKRYESTLDGRRYHVLEKRYAIFPQRSGELVIPREVFVGTLGRGGLFSRRQRINTASESLTVKVKPVPASFSGDNWLPAKSLAITESWAAQPPVFSLGEPLNRQLTITASGLADALLPPLQKMQVNNAKLYADPPVTTRQLGSDGVTAVQVTNIGVVPIKEGTMTLPEIRLPWWNLLEDTEEVAIIPAATYQILPAPGVDPAAQTITTRVGQPPFAEAPVATAPVWQYVSAVLALLWILSAWQWFASRRALRALGSTDGKDEAPQCEDPDEPSLFRGVTDACKRGEAAEAHRWLSLWAKARFPDLGSVREVARADACLAEEVERLERLLYGRAEQDSGDSWDGRSLAILVTEIRNRPTGKVKAEDLVTRLNPV